MEKKTLLALAISFLVLGFYPVLLQKFYPDYYNKSEPVKTSIETSPTASNVVAPSTGLPVAPTTHEKLSAEKDQIFQNKKIQLSFNPSVGAIRGIAFPAFIDSETSKPLQLFMLEQATASPTSLSVLGATAPSEYVIQISSDGRVDSIGASSQLKITRHYVFDAQRYDAKLSVVFQNTSSAPLEFRYQFFAGPSVPPRHSIDGQYIEANFYLTQGGKIELRHIKQDRLGKKVESQRPVEWLAVKDRHFSIILKPASAKDFTGVVEGLGNHRFAASLVSPALKLSPGETIQHDFVLYIGPNEMEALAPAGLETIVNFGKLDAISRVLVGILELLHKVFRNYGVAIIVLTVLINVLLFPLTRVSYLSMKRMQLVQPQMAKLKEQHKNNPERMNKETMELYRKHKVNPFGGCLPMLLQMPIFIALYVALSKSVILINSQLFWIKDLSSPDSVWLPFHLPFLGNQIHVLPLVMCVAMFFQQKLTQIKLENQDPAMQSQQKMMSLMMPIIFGFIFYTMPSGLVLYWLTNTLLMTAYQLRLKNMTLA